MTLQHVIRCAALVGVSAVLAACGPRVEEDSGVPDDPDRHAPPQVVVDRLPGAALVLVPVGASDSDPTTFEVELATTHAARERGLMGRETLGLQRGMLFVYREPARHSFWMKNCLIGLDIAFLDADGRILKAATLPPGIGLVGDDVPSVACEGKVKFVLEVRARRLSELGVGSGDLVDLRAAVEGVHPE